MSDSAKEGQQATKPFVNWINLVNVLIEEITKSYSKVEYNRNTCLILIDRVDTISPSIRALHRRREESESKFRNQNFYIAFIKFHRVLTDIKGFIGDISQLIGYKKFKDSNEVKGKFLNIITEFETLCIELGFSNNVIVTEKDREREIQILKEDSNNTIKILKKMEDDITIKENGEEISLNMIYEEVSELQKRAEKLEGSLLHIPQISPNKLEPPSQGKPSDIRGMLCKRMLTDRSVIPVACKRMDIPSSQSQRIKAQLSILNRLRSNDKIIKFYGTSTLNDHEIMVLEWAEHGDLKKLYESEKLSWSTKLQYAHDICKGLVFLQALGIFHHDIRCENIMIVEEERRTAKIANFNLSREVTAETCLIQDLGKIVRWLAPEKMEKARRVPYNFRCEIFSFGMLLWELAYQKIPYEQMELAKIMEHVLEKKREKLDFDIDEHQDIIYLFCNAIELSWSHEPNKRPRINDLFQEFSSLLYREDDGIDESEIYTDTDADDISEESDEIIPLEEGIKAHRSKNYEKAWKCFEKHAALGDPKAKYWLGYCLYDGIYKPKDQEKAVQLYKEAADAGVADAQLRYAFAMKKKEEVFMTYLVKAANNGNSTAQFNLGDIYLKGLCGLSKDKEKGLLYFRLAALKKHPLAIKLLKQYNIDDMSSQ
ncbi:1522_t:CDS:2 [Acaulospora morrowiae]|uniref:1522_t:CDS:1 n=1 Tax=Acaulospora morrowiae TaxID=94023 RepID=A0A9N8V365_9GLOM|nr:1522_t:CDS:2 [Acaulospora morrowiae]